MANPTMTVAEREAFLAAPRVAVLSVARNEGPPLTAPTWYHYAPGGQVTFFTGTQGSVGRKTGLIERAGQVSLCVQQDEMPYKYVTVEAALVTIAAPPAEPDFLAIVRRYLPEEHAVAFVQAELANPGPGLVLITVRPDRWLTSDTAKAQA